MASIGSSKGRSKARFEAAKFKKSIHSQLAHLSGVERQVEAERLVEQAQEYGFTSLSKMVASLPGSTSKSIKHAYHRLSIGLSARVAPEPPDRRVRHKRYENGDVYKGAMKNGMREGPGKLQTREGTYKGDFKNNVRHGQGRMRFTPRNELNPQDVSAERSFSIIHRGFCEAHEIYKRLHPDGPEIDSPRLLSGLTDAVLMNQLPPIKQAKYEGEWCDDLPSGQGKYRYENGDVYEGSFVGGIRQGLGVYMHSSGDRYEGGFWGDVFSGAGSVKDKNDVVVFDGRFEAGLPIQPPPDNPEVRQELIESTQQQIEEVERRKEDAVEILEALANDENDNEAQYRAELLVREKLETYRQMLIEKYQKELLAELDDDDDNEDEKESDVDDLSDEEKDPLTPQDILARNIETLQLYARQLAKYVQEMDEAEVSLRSIEFDEDELRRAKEEVEESVRGESQRVLEQRNKLRESLSELGTRSEQYFGGKAPKDIEELKYQVDTESVFEDAMAGMNDFEEELELTEEALEEALEELDDEDAKQERDVLKQQTRDKIAQIEEKIGRMKAKLATMVS